MKTKIIDVQFWTEILKKDEKLITNDIRKAVIGSKKHTLVHTQNLKKTKSISFHIIRQKLFFSNKVKILILSKVVKCLNNSTP